jgi:hypothetical protein
MIPLLAISAAFGFLALAIKPNKQISQNINNSYNQVPRNKLREYSFRFFNFSRNKVTLFHASLENNELIIVAPAAAPKLPFLLILSLSRFRQDSTVLLASTYLQNYWTKHPFVNQHKS